MIFIFFYIYNIESLKKMLYDFLMMFREIDKKFYFLFLVGLDVSKIFLFYYIGVGLYIIVSRMIVIFYFGYY